MISIILPTYNENGNIKKLINAIHFALHDYKHEIIVIDDDSTDGTGDTVESMDNKRVKLIRRKDEKGLATAIRRGVDESRGEYIVVMDSDLSHPPEVIRDLVKKITSSKADMVIASRFIKGGGMDSERHKCILSKLLNKSIKIITGSKINDLTGGFFVVRKNMLEKIDSDKVFVDYGDYFYRLDYFLRKTTKNYKVIEIPFHYQKRTSGESKTKTFRAGIKYLAGAIRIRTGI